MAGAGRARGRTSAHDADRTKAEQPHLSRELRGQHLNVVIRGTILASSGLGEDAGVRIGNGIGSPRSISVPLGARDGLQGSEGLHRRWVGTVWECQRVIFLRVGGSGRPPDDSKPGVERE